MFSRRSLFSRVRDAALAVSVPAVAASLAGRRLYGQESEAAPAAAAEGFACMPSDNPPYGAPPLTFGPRSGVTVVVKTDKDLVRALAPAPLEPTGAELMIQQHQNTIISPLRVAYPNATVIVPVTLHGAEGFYMARVYEGSHNATMLSIWGREIWGFPKTAATTGAVRQGDQAHSFLRAQNAWASVALQLGKDQTEEPAGDLSLFCRKLVPSCDGQGRDLDRLVKAPWRHTPETRVVGTVSDFHFRLDVGGKSVALPVEEFVTAFWFTQSAGTILDKGEVVHDYLA